MATTDSGRSDFIRDIIDEDNRTRQTRRAASIPAFRPSPTAICTSAMPSRSA